MGLLIAAVGVVALGQRKIGDRELLGGDRPDVDPETLEQRHSIIRKQLSPCPQSEGAFHRNSGINVKINQNSLGTHYVPQNPFGTIRNTKQRRVPFLDFEAIVVSDRSRRVGRSRRRREPEQPDAVDRTGYFCPGWSMSAF